MDNPKEQGLVTVEVCWLDVHDERHPPLEGDWCPESDINYISVVNSLKLRRGVAHVTVPIEKIRWIGLKRLTLLAEIAELIVRSQEDYILIVGEVLDEVIKPTPLWKQVDKGHALFSIFFTIDPEAPEHLISVRLYETQFDELGVDCLETLELPIEPDRRIISERIGNLVRNWLTSLLREEEDPEDDDDLMELLTNNIDVASI